MLTHLYIKNYALISHLDIDFTSGFSVLTGETGAGKSIILGALSLVMGARADTKTITEGEDRCVIEATFNGEKEYIIRRELNSNGRSRSLVNDEVVSQAELKSLARQLVDIHSQHENLLLNDDSFQLSIVDAIAQGARSKEQKQRTKNKGRRASAGIFEVYTEKYEAYCNAQQALADLRALAAKSSQDQDYLSFQLNQLQEAHLVSGEEQELETEQYQLSHADQIQQSLQQAIFKLDSDEHGVLSQLHELDLSDASEELQERLKSAEIELKDILRQTERLADHIEADPARLQEVEARIDLINSLLKKHHKQTVDELVTLRDELAAQCSRFEHFEEDIAELEEKVKGCKFEVSEAAKALTESRKAVRDIIVKNLTENLTKLGINHAKVDIEYNTLPDFTPSGIDDIQFLFAANLNQSLRRVSEVASGGEIARIMLCIKALIASTNGLPTIVFDEIDTGVSGAVAVQMGTIMKQMAQSRQIIAITHNPQITVQADTQYLVYKQDEKNHTETHIRQLNADERQQYIDQYYATISRAIASKNAE